MNQQQREAAAKSITTSDEMSEIHPHLPPLEQVDTRPVALAAGYIDPLSKEDRQQVILVLRRDLVLLCFNTELQLLWESHLRQEIDIASHHVIVARDTSIMITSTPIHKDDRGAIVVGVRVTKESSGFVFTACLLCFSLLCVLCMMGYLERMLGMITHTLLILQWPHRKSTVTTIILRMQMLSIISRTLPSLDRVARFDGNMTPQISSQKVQLVVVILRVS